MKRFFNYTELKDYARDLLVSAGIKKKSAAIVADVLVTAEFQGVSSHGLTRMEVYLSRIKEGLINKDPYINTEFKFPTLGIMDADNALGHVSSYNAMSEVIRRAKIYGISMIGVKNSNHFGTASYFAEMAVQENLVGLVISNGPPATPPWGGKEMYFGTNPLAVGIPGGAKGPIIVDMATSIVARGKIIKAAKEGKPIKLGWALDMDGNPTSDANEALKGCIMPMGEHKGSAITMLIELMAGLLTGAGYGKKVAWQYDKESGKSNVGHMFCAINPKGFMDIEEIRVRMDNFYDEIKAMPKAFGYDSIRLPGENRRKNMNRNIENGILLNDTLYSTLIELGYEYNIKIPVS